MGYTNPIINEDVRSVPDILGAIPRSNPAKVKVTGTIPFPDWFGVEDHIQGIAPLNGKGTTDDGSIGGSSTDGAYFASYAGSSPTVKSVTIATSRPVDYDHTGGIQALGDLLAVPIESDKSDDKGIVRFYDIANLASPALRYELAMPDRKASAVAITNWAFGLALLAVYEYDPRYMRFYSAPAASVGGPTNPWTSAGRYTGSAFGGDQYQCFSLVTGVSQGIYRIYLLGFREDEELHLFNVEMNGSQFKTLYEIAKYTGWSGSDWRNGVGLQICDETKLRIFGTDKDPSGDSDDYSFHVYVWG